MSVLGAVVVAVLIGVLLTDFDRLPLLLAAVVPFGATSAITVAGQSIIPYHIVAMAVVATSAASLARAYRTALGSLPGAKFLIAFCLWSLLITLVNPRLFAGLAVLDPRRGIDEGVKNPSILGPSISNFAQSGYLILAVLTVFAIAFNKRHSYVLPAVAFGIATVLSSLKGLLPVSAQAKLFDNSDNVAYTAGKFEGVERMRGLFSEPSSLGAVSIAASIYFAVMAARTRGLARVACLVLAVWALSNAVLSYSGGAVATGVVIVAIVIVRGSILLVLSRNRLSSFGATVLAALPATALVVGPVVLSFVSSIIVDKSGSVSAENRSAADAFSLRVLWESAGLGTGLGSNRPSSFLSSLLSNCGILGTLLLLLAIILILVTSFRDNQYQPAVWAAIALLVSKMVAGPDISDPFLWFLLAVCARGAWKTSEPETTKLPSMDAFRAQGARTNVR